MKKLVGSVKFLVVLLLCISFVACTKSNSDFVVIVLGTAGGSEEDNLSSYLLASAGDTNFVALDAGTLNAGIQKAREMGSFHDFKVPSTKSLTLEGWILKERIKAYLISHAHLDHISGLIINSPEDSKKYIMGLNSTIDDIRNHAFNWHLWPNFGNEGTEPHLNKYEYIRLTSGQEYSIPNTSMTVKAFPLSHSGVTSTAFLIESKGSYALYFGDTGPDSLEKSNNLKIIWTEIVPLIQNRSLKAIFLEVSFPNEKPDDLLFGHLTPSWMMVELRNLARLVDSENPEAAIDGLNVVVTHIKPSFEQGVSTRSQISQQLQEENDLQINFILAEQGQRMEF